MKQLLTLILSAIALCSFGQSSFYSVQTDNNNTKPTYLKVLPWDENSLIQINQEFNAQTMSFEYSMEDISAGNPILFNIPSCPVVSSKPIFLSNGILATGEIGIDGMELIYFDGLNSVTFDINLTGDSDPEIIRMEENTFIIAEDTTGARQLFQFDELSVSLTQVSWFQSGINVTHLAAVWQDTLYYGIELDNQATRIYQLQEAIWDGNYYQSSVFDATDVPITSNFFYRWENPIKKWGRIFLTGSKYSTDPMDTIEQRIIFNGGPGYLSYTFQTSTNNPLRMFEFNNNIYAYLFQGDTLFSYNEFIQGNPPEALSVNQVIANGSLVSHFVSGNNKLYLKKLLLDNTHELNRFDGQTLTPIFSGNHVHKLLENNGVIYFSNNNISPDTNSVILLNTAWDGVDIVEIEVGDHAPAIEAAVMYDNKFTFFFNDATLTSTDVYQLIGSPLAELVDYENYNLEYYPNPVSKNEIFTIKVERDTEYTLLNSVGQVMEKGKLFSGQNNLYFHQLSTGLYMLKVKGMIGRIVLTE
jgi:hypothetical protein